MPSNLPTLVTLTILILAVFVEAGHPESHSRLFSADLFPSGLFPPVQSLERHRRNAQGFVCTSEGYHPDPHNCRVYHRCVDWGNGRPLTVFDFECGEGTVFSPTKGNICTFPQESGRPECSGNDNEIDSTFPSTSQTPSTQWATQEVSTSTKTTTSPTTTTQNLTTTKQPQRPPPPTTTNPPTTSSQRPGTGGQGGNNGQIRCTQEGFLADPNNCKKFHRCVNEGSGQFARYEYVCGEGTVWDPKIQGCNYPWAASRKDCKDGSGEGGSNGDNNGQWNGDNSGQWNGDTGDNGGQWNGDTGDNGGQWDGNTGGPIPPGGSNGQTGQPGKPGDTSGQPGTAGSPGSPGSSGTPGTPGTPAHASEPGECPGEGFFPDPEDCRKFYRCVGSGPVYLVYDFQCSPGTAWDPSVQSCNHDYLVPNCKNGSTTSGVSGTTEPITPSSGTSESGVTEPTSHPPPTNSTSTSNQTTGGTTPTPGSSQCPGEGFFPNPNDCTKFFRCVSTDHGLQRYDFKCAPGTAWDQKIKSCNYIDQVDSCKGSSGTTPGSTSTTAKPGTTSTKVPGTSTNASSTTENTPSPTPKPSTETSTTSSTSSTSTESNTPSSISPNSTTETSTTPSTSTSSTAETSTPPSTSTSSSTETGTPPSTSSNATTETTTPSSTSNTSSTEPTTPDCTKKPNSTIVCTEPGYFPHPTECAKFYRCVDNGKGFNVYIFDCAPGTIFDPSIDACNYPESVYPPRDCMMPTQGTSTPTSSTTEQTTTTTGSTETATPVSSSLTTAVNTESTTEGTTESTSEATTTSTSETATESTSEAITESTSEATTESTSEATTSSTSEGTTESTSVATEESTSEGTTQSTSEATTASTTEGTTESTSESTVESTSEATTESTSEGTTESTSVATAESTSEATTQSTSEATTESTSEATTESTSEATTESTSEAATESSSTTVTTESSTDGTTESSTVIATETTELSTTGPTSTPPATWTPTTEPTTTSTPCPIGNLTNEQIALVCPTGFRRHPKYCNLFYQCTSDRSTDIKVLILSCPTGTIYDDRKVQCLPEDESSEPCTGSIAVERFYRKLTESSISPVEVSTNPLCPSEGYHAYKRGCGNAFYKCSRDYKNDIQGYLYKCPPNYFYWSVSRRCEHAIRLPICVINAAHTSAEWDKRWQVPIEDFNLDARSLDLF